MSDKYLKIVRTVQTQLYTREEIAAIEAEKRAIREADMKAERDERERKEAEEREEALKAENHAAMIAEAAEKQMGQTSTEDDLISPDGVVAQSSDGDDFSRTRARTNSTASSVRPRNSSVSGIGGPRRNSSIFIRLPDLAGTSLIRKSADAVNLANQNIGVNVGSGESDIDLFPSDDQNLHSPIPFKGRRDSGRFENLESPRYEANDEAADCSMDLNVSRFPPNDQSMFVDPCELSTSSDVALFEHFIVVGASEQVTYLPNK